jgi:hypothetical protein
MTALILWVALTTQPPLKLLDQARAALTNGRYPEAEKLARRLTQRSPGESNGWLFLGTALLHEGNAPGASSALRRAAELDPKSGITWFNLASAQFSSDAYADAESAFLRSAELDPELARLALLNAGLAAAKRGDLARAEKLRRDALTRGTADEVTAERARLLDDAIAGKRTSETMKRVTDLIHRGSAALEGGDEELAEAEFSRALVLTRDGTALHNQIAGILSTLHKNGDSRFFIQLGVSMGYDSNVAQTALLGAALNSSGLPGAAFLGASLETGVRIVGSADNHLFGRYSFSQLAYFDSTFQADSLQSHALELSVQWTAHPRLVIEPFIDGNLQLDGITSFGLFQTAVDAGLRLNIREGNGFETRLRYEHDKRFALNSNFSFLSGDADEAAIAERYNGSRLRLAVEYSFQSEGLGYEEVPFVDVRGPLALGGVDGTYHIPFGYLAHVASLSSKITSSTPFSFGIGFRFEHRDYRDPSYLESDGGARFAYRNRIDNRFSVDAKLEANLSHGLAMAIGYTFIDNLSNIDYTNQATAFDYGVRSFTKHLIEIEVSYVY